LFGLVEGLDDFDEVFFHELVLDSDIEDILEVLPIGDGVVLLFNLDFFLLNESLKPVTILHPAL